MVTLTGAERSGAETYENGLASWHGSGVNPTALILVGSSFHSEKKLTILEAIVLKVVKTILWLIQLNGGISSSFDI